MSGHSKWANIKHRKGKQDALKANVYTKLANVIIVAARTNKGLDLAIERAKKANMTKDKIDHAIAKGRGEIAGEEVAEIIYEAYLPLRSSEGTKGGGPEGVAIIIKVLTDNKNRALSSLRSILNQYNGKLANSGAVSYLFDQKGVMEINLQNQAVSKEDLEMIIIESGASDYEEDEGRFFVYADPKKLEIVKKNIEFKAIKIDSAKIEMLPKTYASINEDKKESIIKLLEELEEDPDVDEVYTNADL